VTKLKKKQKRNKTKILLIVAGTLIGLIAVIGISGNLYVDSLLNKTNRSKKLTDEQAMVNQEVKNQVQDHKIVNIALFGSDNQDWNEWTDTEMQRSDATKIISLDFNAKKIKITSLQRDTLVYLPEPYNDYDKLNHAHWRGGPELAIQTINLNFDMDITQYVGFSFEATVKLVDLVGGIDLYLTAEETHQKIRDLQIDGDDGVYHLNGQQVKEYCRIRTIDDDFHRMKRQNTVIMAILTELRTKNFWELMDIVEDMMPWIETNLTNDQIKNYIMNLLTFDLKHIDQYQIPSTGMEAIYKTVEYNDFSPLYVMDSYQQMVKDIHENIYEMGNYQPSTKVIELEKSIYEKFGGPE